MQHNVLQAQALMLDTKHLRYMVSRIYWKIRISQSIKYNSCWYVGTLVIGGKINLTFVLGLPKSDFSIK